MSVCVCRLSGRYCLVVLLGNGRVTLCCNRGYERIRYSLWLYRKEKRGHCLLRGWEGVSGWVERWVTGRVSPVTLDSRLRRPCRSFHTQQAALAPRYISTANNGRRLSSQSAPSNCFLSLLPCFRSEVMNGHRDLGCRPSGGGHFYETKILMGDPWGTAGQERGQTWLLVKLSVRKQEDIIAWLYYFKMGVTRSMTDNNRGCGVTSSSWH